MQALKALVIGMAVLIVLGVTVVVVTIYKRLNPAGGEPPPAAVATAPAPTPAGGGDLAAFGEAQVTIPEGCRVIEMLPDGDRLLLRLGSLPRCSRILVVDLTTGRQLGAIEILSQP